MEVSQYVLEVFEDEKRLGFSKEAYLNQLLEMMTGPSGVVSLLLAVMTHGRTFAAFTETSHPTCEILVLVYLL